MVIFRSQKGSASKEFVKQLLTPLQQEAIAVFNRQSAPTNRNMSFLPTHATVGSIEMELLSYQST